MTANALERVVARGAARRDPNVVRCGLCAAPIGAEHRHLLDVRARGVVCACRDCALLFDTDGRSGGDDGARHFLRIPTRRRPLSGIAPGDLGLPVGLACVVAQLHGGALARYPSPLGFTEWEVDAGRWGAALAHCEGLDTLEPEVEAVLFCFVRDRSRVWIAPIDDAFRLAALVRAHWHGLSGGDEIWRAIDEFFEEVEQRWERSGSARPA